MQLVFFLTKLLKNLLEGVHHNYISMLKNKFVFFIYIIEFQLIMFLLLI